MSVKPARKTKPPKQTKRNEISQENIFENFIPGQQVEIDYAQKGSNDYLMIVCSLTETSKNQRKIWTQYACKP